MATAQKLFNEIEQELGVGMVPRLFKLLEDQPVLLSHIWGQFRMVVLQGSLPRIVKEMVGLAIATATHCDYIRVVHLHSLSIQGVDERTLKLFREGNYTATELSSATRAALRFADSSAETRAAYVTEAWPELRRKTAQALTETDLDEVETAELVLTVALFEQLCTIANLLALDPSQP